MRLALEPACGMWRSIEFPRIPRPHQVVEMHNMNFTTRECAGMYNYVTTRRCVGPVHVFKLATFGGWSKGVRLALEPASGVGRSMFMYAVSTIAVLICYML